MDVSIEDAGVRGRSIEPEGLPLAAGPDRSVVGARELEREGWRKRRQKACRRMCRVARDEDVDIRRSNLVVAARSCLPPRPAVLDISRRSLGAASQPPDFH